MSMGTGTDSDWSSGSSGGPGPPGTDDPPPF